MAFTGEGLQESFQACIHRALEEDVDGREVTAHRVVLAGADTRGLSGGRLLTAPQPPGSAGVLRMAGGAGGAGRLSRDSPLRLG